MGDWGITVVVTAAIESPEDRFHFTPAPEENIMLLMVPAVPKDVGHCLFINQSGRGGELCLLDATYRTTKYAVPLFFICVKTSTDYAVVAVFACQFEDSNVHSHCPRHYKGVES